jgi:hypothetical protein
MRTLIALLLLGTCSAQAQTSREAVRLDYLRDLDRTYHAGTYGYDPYNNEAYRTPPTFEQWAARMNAASPAFIQRRLVYTPPQPVANPSLPLVDHDMHIVTDKQLCARLEVQGPPALPAGVLTSAGMPGAPNPTHIAAAMELAQGLGKARVLGGRSHFAAAAARSRTR